MTAASCLQCPSLAFLLCVIGLFVSQTLDALDGKQARRLHQATQLGELLDHGCDALSLGEREPRAAVRLLATRWPTPTTARAVRFVAFCFAGVCLGSSDSFVSPLKYYRL